MTNMIIPMDHRFEYASVNEHWHSPTSGGELVWNNVQWVNRINAIIREINKTIDERFFGVFNGDKDHIPYLEVPINPTHGYNEHHHTSFADGGLIFGGGLHDHRSTANGGFAYAVYHPGTSLPSMAYEKEEVT